MWSSFDLDRGATPSPTGRRADLARRIDLLADWVEALVHGRRLSVLPVAPEDAALLETVRVLQGALQPVEPRREFMDALGAVLVSWPRAAPPQDGAVEPARSGAVLETFVRMVRAVAAAAPVWEAPYPARATSGQAPHWGLDLAHRAGALSPDARRRVTFMVLGSALSLAGAWLFLSRPRGRGGLLAGLEWPTPAGPFRPAAHRPLWGARFGGRT
jgi:hypothetical protein